MAMIETLIPVKAPPKHRKNVYAALAAFLILWSVNAAMVAMTIGPDDIYAFSQTDGTMSGPANPDEWRQHNPDRLTPLNHQIRTFLVRVDQLLSFPNSRGKTATWTLLIVMPLLLAAYLVSLILTTPRFLPAISGEVLWPRSLRDVKSIANMEINQWLRVSACRIDKSGPAGGQYEVYTPLAHATFGKPYVKQGELMAASFIISGLPLNQPLALECLVSPDFSEKQVDGKLLSRRRGAHISLSEDYPRMDGVVFEVCAFER